MDNARTRYKKWCSQPEMDRALALELKQIENNDAEIEERFGAPMSFGTAGLRSKMGAGISRMNVYTVALTTQALAQLILGSDAADRGCVIACDSRNNSELFARTAAQVLSANGVKAYIFDELRPTPELSFAVLKLGAIAGINITASHNTKEYNGYKVYWEDGAQLSPDHARKVSEAAEKIDIFDGPKTIPFEEGIKAGRIITIGKEIDESYLDAVLGCRIVPENLRRYGNDLKIVFTPLHGCGWKAVPQALRMAGVSDFVTVPEQMIPDGGFPTVVSPNPENPEALEMAIKLAAARGSLLVLGTDPDSDRVGAAVPAKDGSYKVLSGNQMGALLLDYIIKEKKRLNALPANACAIRSVVSSDLFGAIARANGVEPVEVLTGFKYIGEKIKEYEKDGSHTFLLGYEESHGYLSGTYARDKDAVAACLLLAECAAAHHAEGRTLLDALEELYERYGYYEEGAVTVTTNAEGRENTMRTLRVTVPERIASSRIVAVSDFLKGTRTASDGRSVPTGLPLTDMIRFELEDGSFVIIRPSGTEPKIKAYILVKADSAKRAAELCAEYTAAAASMLKGTGKIQN